MLLMAALVAATSDGPAWLDINTPPRLEAPERATSDETRSGQDDAASGGTPAAPTPDSGSSTSPITRTLAIVILILALVIGGVAVAVGLRAVVRRRSLDANVRRSITPEPEPDPSEVLVEEVARGLQTIPEGSPRNAIVATWIRLEDATVAAGFDQRRSETPAEFVRRALATYAVDEHDIGRLADLYREARFSAHPLTEAHRDEAIDCLSRLHGQLTRVEAR